jgi:molybdopterin molybdotransferase
MRPGRPFAFGQLIADNAGGADAATSSRSVPFFGLPGNPVAVMASFYHLVRDALLIMMGARVPALPRISARAAERIAKRAGRSEFARGTADRLPSGEWQVRLAGAQGSGILRSMSEANCFVLLDHEQGTIAAGECVDIMFFEGLI